MNIINAIINLVHSATHNVSRITNGNNRANNMGEGLEKYVKDLFANTLNETNDTVIKNRWSQTFSFLGSKTFLLMACLEAEMP